MHMIKKKQTYLVIFISFLMLLASFQFKVLTASAAENSPTISSVATDHLGKTITMQFDKAMADPTGTQSQFAIKLGSTAQTITSVVLDSDPSQIILNMSPKVGAGSLTLSYTQGSITAADGTQLDNILNQTVTNNSDSTLELVDYEPAATEIGYTTDSSDPLNPTVKYRFNNLMDYDNVNLAVYFSSGFFTPMVNDINTYVKFYEKDTGTPVVLPNILTQPNTASTYTDGTIKNEQIVTDWYFWQISGHAPLGLKLVSRALKPSTSYIVEIDKGFLFNNGNGTKNTYRFEFTTTSDSQYKPSWANGSTLTTPSISVDSLTLQWPAADDNHGAAYVNATSGQYIPNLHYNVYQNGVLLGTTDEKTTSYTVSNLTPSTSYQFKVEAVDFAGNVSPGLETTATTSNLLPPPTLTADTTDTLRGYDVDLTFGSNPTWQAAISDITVNGTSIKGQCSINDGVITINSGAFVSSGDYFIVVKAADYSDASVTQTLTANAPPTLNVDSTNNVPGQAIDVTFTDDSVWRTALTGVTVNGSVLSSEQYTVSAGNINIVAPVFGTDGTYSISAIAKGYNYATVSQIIAPSSVSVSNYTDLKAAMTGAPIGSTREILLLGDIDFNGNQIVFSDNSNKSIIIKNATANPITITSLKLNADATNTFMFDKNINFIGGPNSTYGIYISGKLTCTVNGTVTGKYSGGSSSTYGSGLYVTSGSTGGAHITVNGDVSAATITGSGASSVGGIYINKAGSIVTVNGKVAGGSAGSNSSAYGIYNTAGIVIVNGSVTGGTALGTLDGGPGIYGTGSDSLTTVNGDVAGGSTLAKTTTGLSANSGCTITVNGNVTAVGVTGATGVSVTNASNVVINGNVSSSYNGVLVTVSSASSAVNSAVTVNGNIQGTSGYGAIARIYNTKAFTANVSYKGTVTGSAADKDFADTVDEFTGLAYTTYNIGTYTDLRTPAPVLKADSTDNNVGQDIDLTFTDDTAWRSAITGVTADGTPLVTGQYILSAGNLNIAAGVLNAVGNHLIVVQAANYSDASVTQETTAPVQVTLSSIAVTTPAAKLIYTVGDALELTGLVVTGTYSDGSTTPEAITLANITGFDSTTPAAIQVLTITAGGQTTTYTVTINSGTGGTTGSAATTLVVSGPATVTIPASSTTVNYTASVKDQDGNPITGETVTWSLQLPVSGVSISTTSGAVTIDNSTSPGAFTVVAADGNVSGSKLVSLTAQQAATNLADLKATVANNTVLVGHYLFQLSDTNGLTQANVLAAMATAPAQPIYFKSFNGRWYDLNAVDSAHIVANVNDLTNVSKAIDEVTIDTIQIQKWFKTADTVVTY